MKLFFRLFPFVFDIDSGAFCTLMGARLLLNMQIIPVVNFRLQKIN